MNFLKLYRSEPVQRLVTNRKPTSKSTKTFSVLETHLPQCRNVKQFKQILSLLIFSGFMNDAYAASLVIKFSTASSFIHLSYTRQIFDRSENSNVFTWNTMMRAYSQEHYHHAVIYMYKLMLEKRICPDNFTFPILVHASALRFSEFEGKEFHDHSLQMGFDSDVYVRNTLINLYSISGDLRDARKMFDESSVLDTVSWNSMLTGYVHKGDVEGAMLIFSQMPGRKIIASNSIIVLLGKVGRVIEARCLFDEMPEKDMFSWTALISSYVQNGMYQEALSMFINMRSNGVMMDEIVLVSVLSLCAHLSLGVRGKWIHGFAVKNGTESYVNLQNALIHMYSSCGETTAAEKLFNASHQLDLFSWNSMIHAYFECGSAGNACNLFNSMPVKDIVSWNTMISGHARNNQFSEALAVFDEMQLQEIRPDETILVSVISACTHLAALDLGKWVHAYIRKSGLKLDGFLGTALIDMYMKCGCVKTALGVFQGMEEKGVSVWNALILGLSLNGMVETSLEMFTEMKKSGVVPNEITFVGVILACRNMGSVNEGWKHFNSMIKEYGIEPNVKHYGCMVDLLGRAGFLKEAEQLVNSMPMAPSAPTWGALLGACKKHGNNEMGERIGRKLIELQPDHDGFHVLLSNICASKGNWEDVSEIRGTMMHRGVSKTPGCSVIEANGVVHEFLAGDTTLPQMIEIE